MNTKKKITCIALALAATSAHAVDLRSWDKKISSGAERFQVLAAFNNEAVLDKETQVVWHKSSIGMAAWHSGRNDCLEIFRGGRKGWRLPSVHELGSLVAGVPERGGKPALPFNHPFSNIDASDRGYWSATRSEEADLAYFVRFSDGEVLQGHRAAQSKFVWCVRGGAVSSDQY